MSPSGYEQVKTWKATRPSLTSATSSRTQHLGLENYPKYVGQVQLAEAWHCFFTLSIFSH